MTSPMTIEKDINSRFFEKMKEIVSTHPDFVGKPYQNVAKAKFARSVGWQQQNLEAALSGRRGVPLKILVNMGKVYGVDMNWLLLGVNNIVNKPDKK